MKKPAFIDIIQYTINAGFCQQFFNVFRKKNQKKFLIIDAPPFNSHKHEKSPTN